MAAVSADSGGAKEGFGVSEIGRRQRSIEIPAGIAAFFPAPIQRCEWRLVDARCIEIFGRVGCEMKLAGGVHDTLLARARPLYEYR
jgi:hypothetical protein